MLSTLIPEWRCSHAGLARLVPGSQPYGRVGSGFSQAPDLAFFFGEAVVGQPLERL